MRNILILIFAIFFSTCFGQGEFEYLKKAYKNNSQNKYGQFLQKWYEKSIPITSIDSLSNLQKEVCEIYKDFYNPFNLQRIGVGNWDNKLYSKIDYVVVQNSISIYVYKTDSLNFSFFDDIDSLVLIKDSIVNFRPKLQFKQAKILYLLPQYEIIINKFLGNKNYPLKTSEIINSSNIEEERAKRLNFLNKKLNIIHERFKNDWHIKTHPEVFSIDFNNDRTIAKVNYRLVYQGGKVIYIKQNGKWKWKDAYLIWSQ